MTRSPLARSALLCLLLFSLVAPARAADAGLAAADEQFEDFNFACALEAYDTWLETAADPASDEAVQARTRRVQCLLHLARFDEALSAAGEIAVDGGLGLLDRALAEHTLSQVWQQLPGHAFLRDGEYRYDYADREGEYTYRGAFNQLQARAHLERAKLLADGALREHRAGRLDATTDPFTAVIELDQVLVVDYVTVGEQLAYEDFTGSDRDDLPADPTFDPRGPTLDRILFLYDEIEALDRERPGSDLRAAARAVLDLALVLEELPWHIDADELASRPEIPEPLEVVERLLTDYPDDPDHDLFVVTRAHLLENRGRFVEAEQVLVDLLAAQDEGDWLDTARAALQRLRHPSLTLTSVSVIRPGGTTELPLQTRNVDRVRFTAWRVDLQAVLGNGARLRNPHVGFDDFQRNFGSIVGVRKHYLEQVAAWQLDTGDTGEHAWLDHTTALPLAEPGAYVVEATGGRVDTAMLVVVSDITAIVRQDESSALVFVADARDGFPLADFPLIVKETYWDSTGRGRYRTALLQAWTGPDGTFRHDMVGDQGYGGTVAVLAAEGELLAVTPEMWLGTWYGGAPGHDRHEVYCATDRPVYRPGHTVQFKHVVRAVRGGEFANVPDLPVQVTVTDPRGDEAWSGVLTASAFGTVHGHLELPEQTPLGVYTFHLRVEGTDEPMRLSSGSQFRVEEYRKPEFEVTVTAAQVESRPGVAIPVEIVATYFFGAPVSDARVGYQVWRTPYHHRFARSGPFDWLYGEGYGLMVEQPWLGGEELVDSGELTTDAEGIATLSLDPPVDDAQDFVYRVVADVTDLARRTHDGAGEVVVTHQPWFAALHAPRGFYAPGETVELEVRAETSGRVPVAAEGTLSVVRVRWPEGLDDEELTGIAVDEVALDEHGITFAEFVPDESGAYRVLFHSASGDVQAQLDLWVFDEQFPGQRIRFGDLELITDRRHYEQGDTLRLMVQSPYEDPTVLLSFDGDEQLIAHHVLEVDGRSAVVELPLTGAHVPNFFVRAVMAHDYRVLADDREVFVPPTQQLLDVTVQPDAEEYRPGQTGTVQITVRDAAGEPVQGEFSLAAVDRALYHVQADAAGDPRAFFHGDRRYGRSQLVHSGAFLAWPQQRDRNRWRRFDEWSIPYPQYTAWGWGGGMSGYHTPSADMVLEDSGGVFGPRRAERDLTVAEAPPPPLDVRDPEQATPTVRTDLRDTAHWEPVVLTDEQGRATVTVPWPDTLTTWDVVVRGVDADTRVGAARVDAVTSRELLVRLAAPRFMVEADRLVLSALVTNRTAEEVTATVALDLPADLLGARGEVTQVVAVPPGGQVRVDLPLEVLRSGDASVTASVTSDVHSDAVQLAFPVLPWGAERTVAQAAVLRDMASATFALDLPRDHAPGSPVLTLHLHPSLATVMLDAVPYLVDYPYGCVEQTLSRFVPAAITASTLREMGVDLDELSEMASGPLGAEAVTLAAPLHRAAVTDPRTLDRAVRRGVGALVAFQNADGGWGWWKGGSSDSFMTGYVVAGLHEAREAGYVVNGISLGRGTRYLQRRLEAGTGDRDGTRAAHERIWMAHALSLRGRLEPADLDAEFEARADLSPYGKALLALALHGAGDAERARMVVENLRDLVRLDEASGTASFGFDETDTWWHWYDDRVEATAYALQAVLAVDPDDPLADGLARWLVVSRRGNRWSDTRETAIAIRALAALARARGELQPDLGVAVLLDGVEVASYRITADDLLSLPSELVFPGDALAAGRSEVRIDTSGTGALYATAYLTYVTRERRIVGTGNLLSVQRTYHRLDPETDERTALRAGDEVASGDLVEVHVAVEAPVPYDYVMFEDFKPAGFEPVARKSGVLFEHGAFFNRELRDEKVAFFLDRLRQGRQVLTYRLRAETPGVFRVLPHRGEAMYAPRIQAISDSFEIQVVDPK